MCTVCVNPVYTVIQWYCATSFTFKMCYLNYKNKKNKINLVVTFVQHFHHVLATSNSVTLLLLSLNTKKLNQFFLFFQLKVSNMSNILLSFVRVNEANLTLNK